MSTIGTPPDYAEALVFTGAGEVQAYSARTADLASQPDFSSSDGTYTLIGMGNERVRLQRLADGTVSWYDRATTSDDATPVHVPIGTPPRKSSPQPTNVRTCR